MENKTRFSNAIVAVFAAVVFALFFSLSSIAEEAHAYTNDYGTAYALEDRIWEAENDYSDYPIFSSGVSDDNGNRLESFDAEWDNGANDLFLEADNQYSTVFNPVLTISYSLSGKNDYAPGSININIPYKVFNNFQTGDFIGDTDIPVAVYPELSSHDEFSYQLDEEKNLLTLTNTKTVSAASEHVFDIVYKCGESAMYGSLLNKAQSESVLNISNRKFVFSPSLSINDQIMTRTMPLSISVSTSNELEKIALRRGIDSSFWQDIFGMGIKPNNDNDYVYTSVSASISWNKITQDPDIAVQLKYNEDNMILLGYRCGSGDEPTAASGFEPMTVDETGFAHIDAGGVWNHLSAADNGVSSYYIHFLFAIDKKYIEENSTLAEKVKCVLKQTEKETLGKGVAEAECNLKWFAPQKPDGNMFWLYNSITHSSNTIPLNVNLELGFPAPFSTNGYGWGYINDTKSHTVEFIEENVFISNGKKLNEDSYYLSKLYLSNYKFYIGNAISDYETGSLGFLYDSNYIAESEISILAKRNSQWVKIGNAELSDRSNTCAVLDSKTFEISTDAEGIVEYQNGVITFKEENITGFCIAVSTKAECISISVANCAPFYTSNVGVGSPGAVYKLLPSKTITDYIKNEAQQDLSLFIAASLLAYSGNDIVGYKLPETNHPTGYNVLPEQSQEKMKEAEQEEYGTELAHSACSLEFEEYYAMNEGELSLHSYDNVQQEKYANIEYEFDFGTWNFDSFLSEEDIQPALDACLLPGKQYIMYLLLPPGVVFGEARSQAGELAHLETAINYKGTGRSLVALSLVLDDKYASSTYEKVFIDLKYDYDSLIDYGNEIRLSTAMYSVDGGFGLLSGRCDDGGDIIDADILADINDDGSREDLPKYLYNETTDMIAIASSAEMSFSHKVMTAESEGFSSGAEEISYVAPNEEYQYRLRFGSMPNTTTTDMILYANLEQYEYHSEQDNALSRFYGVLESIDCNQPIRKGIEPVAYYSTINDIDFNQHPVSDSEVWTTELPKNKSDIKAVAVDLSRNFDGTKAQLPEDETISVLLNMRAPSADSIDDVSARAYGNAYLRSSVHTVSGNNENQLVNHDFTAIGLNAARITVKKKIVGGTEETSFRFTLGDENGVPVNNPGEISSVASAGEVTVGIEDGSGAQSFIVPSGDYTISEDIESIIEVPEEISISINNEPVADTEATTGAFAVERGKEYDVSFVNDYGDTEIVLAKANAASGERLAGAVFNVSGTPTGETEAISLKAETGDDGATEPFELPQGEYVVVETIPPQAPILDDVPSPYADTGKEFAIVVSGDGSVRAAAGVGAGSETAPGNVSVSQALSGEQATITVGNYANRLTIEKTLNGGDAPGTVADGVVFSLTPASSESASSGKTAIVANGIARFDSLSDGEYTLSEQKGIDGYGDADPVGVSVKNGIVSIGSVAGAAREGVYETSIAIDNVGKASIDVSITPNTELIEGEIRAGDEILYDISLTNTGKAPVSITGTNVPLLGDVHLSYPVSDGELAPGETAVANGVAYPLTQDDIDRGEVRAHVSAVGKSKVDGTPVADDDEAITVLRPIASLSLSKKASPSSIGADAHEGDEISYGFVLENDGFATVEDVSIEEMFERASEPVIDWTASSDPLTGVGTLSPGETVPATASVAVLQTDLDGTVGRITNTALAHGRTPNGEDVSSPMASADTSIVSEARLSLVKTAPAAVSDAQAASGAVIEYSFSVRNDGNKTLSAIKIEDELEGVSEISWENGAAPKSLSPGETAEAKATYSLTQDDVDAGRVVNTAVVSASAPDGKTVKDTAFAETKIDAEAAIELVKEAVPNALDDPKPGDAITYRFTVKNTGSKCIDGVSLEDALLGGDVSYALDKTSIAPGESASASIEYVVAQEDIDAGSITNVARASGTPSGGGAVEDEAEVVTVLGARPSIVAAKHGALSVEEGEAPSAGDEILYAVCVANTGNVSVDSVSVEDAMLGGVLPLDGACVVKGGAGDASGIAESLAEAEAGGDGASLEEIGAILGMDAVPYEGDPLLPGDALVLCGLRCELEQADIDNGHVLNVAHAEGVPANGADGDGDGAPDAVSAEASHDLAIARETLLAIEKTASVDSIDEAAPGAKISYSIKVRNVGNTTIDGIEIEDALPGAALEAPDADVLAPGESLFASASYAVDEDDIANGAVVNVARVFGTSIDAPDGGSIERQEAEAEASATVSLRSRADELPSTIQEAISQLSQTGSFAGAVLAVIALSGASAAASIAVARRCRSVQADGRASRKG